MTGDLNTRRGEPSTGSMWESGMRKGLGALALFGVLSLSLTALAVEEGQRAPEIGLEDRDGNSIRISQLRGKVVIIDFWASWCAPCREEMPFLNELYEEHREDGLVVIGVSVDRQERNVGRFLRRTPVSFPVVHDASQAVAGRYAPGTMPTSVIVDRRGIIRHVHEGFRAGDASRIRRQVEALLD